MKKIFITTPWFVPAFRAGGLISDTIVKQLEEIEPDFLYIVEMFSRLLSTK